MRLWNSANTLSALTENYGVGDASSVRYFGHYPIVDAIFSFAAPILGGSHHGHDYHDALTLWAMPLALEDHDVQQGVQPGTLVYKILTAGSFSIH